MAKVLIVDDELNIRESMRDLLELQNYDVEEAASGNQAVKMVEKQRYDAVFLDIKMSDGDGIETLPKLLTIDPELPVIMMSAHGTIDIAVETMRDGAFDYLTKPLDKNRIMATLRNALDKKELTQINRKLSKTKRVTRVEMIGESKPMRDLINLVDKVAPIDRSVLITGENGSGKELLARMIHEKSNRSNQIFLAVNCAAMAETLLATTLFGYKKGSHSEAKTDQKGLFEEAEGGTLFLDEIGDMSTEAQTKILRVLQERVITRVGDPANNIKVNVRILAATNKDLTKLMNEGKFLIDLYHRLNVVHLRIPSLRERSEDIPLLISYFNNRIAEEIGLTEVKTFSDDAMQLLKDYPWPGNIRELANVIDRLNILCGQEITAADIHRYVLNN